jgi:hypothetical protein
VLLGCWGGVGTSLWAGVSDSFTGGHGAVYTVEVSLPLLPRL